MLKVYILMSVQRCKEGWVALDENDEYDSADLRVRGQVLLPSAFIVFSLLLAVVSKGRSRVGMFLAKRVVSWKTNTICYMSR